MGQRCPRTAPRLQGRAPRLEVSWRCASVSTCWWPRG
jgi:hypothetical protein